MEKKRYSKIGTQSAIALQKHKARLTMHQPSHPRHAVSTHAIGWSWCAQTHTALADGGNCLLLTSRCYSPAAVGPAFFLAQLKYLQILKLVLTLNRVLPEAHKANLINPSRKANWPAPEGLIKLAFFMRNRMTSLICRSGDGENQDGGTN